MDMGVSFRELKELGLECNLDLVTDFTQPTDNVGGCDLTHGSAHYWRFNLRTDKS